MENHEQEQEQSLEEAVHEIEAIVNRMEQEELTLEDAFSLYQSGIEKIRKAESTIGRVESRMKVLMEDGSWGELE